MIQQPSGEVLFPTASEVVGAEHKGRTTTRGIELPRPSQDLPSTTFSRFPLEVRAEVFPPSTDLSRPPSWQLTFRDGTNFVSVEPPPPSADQVITGSQWFPLDLETLESVDDLLRTVGVSSAGSISLRQYLDFLRHRSDLVHVQSHDDSRADRAQNFISSTVAAPAALAATLYPYQQTGYEWLSRIADEGLGGILGDEMGLGKTIQIIALLIREKLESRGPSLVIAPATVLENWRRELSRFAPLLDVEVHRGPNRTGFPRILSSYDVVVTSYETAVRDVSTLEMINWNVLVLDEAQSVKTPDAQRTVTLKTVPRHTCFAVTGTPVENSLRDLWSILDFVLPGFLGPLKDFEQRYSDDIANATALGALVRPVILRRRVEEVATDLPEKIEIPQAIELSDIGAGGYEAIRSTGSIGDGGAESLALLMKLRMYCTHPFLLSDQVDDPGAHSTKYARLLEILDEIVVSGEKVIVFTSFTRMIDILVSDLRQRYGIAVESIDGRTPVVRRQPIIDEFSQRSGSAILALNPKAAGTGLNITAANHVIHYNLEWNPAVEDQATARAYRRGQERPVTVHRMFHAGTVEEVIDERMTRKRQLASEAVVGTEGGQANDLADLMRALQISPAAGGD